MKLTQNKETAGTTRLLCDGCGRENHYKNKCFLQPHPDFNTEPRPWRFSAKGKEWAKRKGKDGQSYRTLPKYLTLDGSPVPTYAKPSATSNYKGASSFITHDKKKGMCDKCKYINSILNNDEQLLIANTVPMTLIYTTTQLQTQGINIHALIDTGSIGPQSDFISETLATTVKLPRTQEVSSVCSGLNGQCVYCSIVNSKLFLSFTNEVTLKNESIEIKPTITKTFFDIIIGRTTIIKNNLINRLTSQFNMTTLTH